MYGRSEQKYDDRHSRAHGQHLNYLYLTLPRNPRNRIDISLTDIDNVPPSKRSLRFRLKAHERMGSMSLPARHPEATGWKPGIETFRITSSATISVCATPWNLLVASVADVILYASTSPTKSSSSVSTSTFSNVRRSATSAQAREKM